MHSIRNALFIVTKNQPLGGFDAFGKTIQTLAMGLGLLLASVPYSSVSYAADNAPAFSLRDINGKQVSLEDYKGESGVGELLSDVVSPCQRRCHTCKDVQVDLEEQGFVVLSISADNARDASKVEAIGEAQSIYLSVLLDKDSTVLNQYNPESVLPYNVLIGKDGNIIWQKASYAPVKK